MGVQEYPIKDAWKYESSDYSREIHNGYEALEEYPLSEIISIKKRSDSIVLILADNKRSICMFLDGVCKNHNLRISACFTDDNGDEHVKLEPDYKNNYGINI